ncbi:hypothetical protein ACFWB2_04705 [Streptomyces virginiae]|uniref:hypothetical protein n=1 Tax=Streptomyces TaxID=1883 RepID=UPI00099C548C|nr:MULTISPECIES: hypothetical protein [Streptomyces]MCX4719581.1 hypothetical protein [Streptomyces virginiae]MCX5271525.1 hypothetical protein [Streptomyces virginiae]MYV76438.1 hypothetical protein [Streptomyces sp. SID1046]WSC77800.1 hypothetical protein OHA56_16500 [Streptomyces virginiae]
MRVMLRAHMDTAATNEGIKTGALPLAITTLMERVKPEAAYFGLHEGVRSCWMVFDLQDSAQMPPLMEDLFLQFNAEVEVAPVMNAEELARGLAAMGNRS